MPVVFLHEFDDCAELLLVSTISSLRDGEEERVKEIWVLNSLAIWTWSLLSNIATCPIIGGICVDVKRVVWINSMTLDDLGALLTKDLE